MCVCVCLSVCVCVCVMVFTCMCEAIMSSLKFYTILTKLHGFYTY